MIVQFNELPAVVRERFVRCSRGGLGAAFWGPSSNMDIALAWLVVFFAGSMLSYLAVQGVGAAAALNGAMFFAALSFTIVRFVLRAPYRAGTFFFPSYVVVARRDGTLSLLPPMNAQSFTLITKRNIAACRLSYPGASVGDVVRFDTAQQAQNALGMYLSSVAQFQQCVAQRDQATLSQIDPFWECTVANQFRETPPSPHGPKSIAVPRPIAGGITLVASGLGGVLALVSAPDAVPVTTSSRPSPNEQPTVVVPTTEPHERVNNPAAAQWLRAAMASPAVRSSNALAIGMRFVPPPESELAAIEASFHVRVPRAAFARYRGLIAQEYETALRAIIAPNATVSAIDFDYDQTSANATFTISLHVRGEGRVARFRRTTGVGLVFEYEGVLHIDGVEDLRSPRVSIPSGNAEVSADLQRAVYLSPDAELGFYQTQLDRGHRDFGTRVRGDWLRR